MENTFQHTSGHKITIHTHDNADDFSFWQRLIMRRFHPMAIVLDTIAFMWCVYFLWNQNWMFALGGIIISRVIGNILSLKLNYKKFSQMTWGKIALLHLNPLNLILQSIGALGLVYGLWIHSTLFILAGVSLIILGHIFGWSKVMDLS